MTTTQVALLGAVIGVPLGYAMQRTHLCFNSAYREVIFHRRTVLLRAIVLAILIQMVALTLFGQLGVGGVQISVVPFFWLAALVGGFVFGISMVYAEGCSSTIWYRVGNGNMGALVALAGFALGEAAISFGPLAPVRKVLQGPELKLADAALATLPNLLGVSPWALVVPIVLVVGLWLAVGPGGSYQGGWTWRRAGLLLGAIGAAAWIVAWPTGWHYGVGIVGATGALVQMLSAGPRVLNWGSFVVLSMPIGAFLAAWRHQELKRQVPDLSSTIRMLVAGTAMGASAAIAGGCNVGHGLTGVPTLALSSLTATIATFLGAWLGNHFRFVRPRRAQSSSQGEGVTEHDNGGR